VLKGAMNRGRGSFGAIVMIDESEAGVPSALPQLVVICRVRSTYSPTVRHPLLGSTSWSPPSPPKGDTCPLFCGSSSETPLSCRPPQTWTDPGGAPGWTSLPTATE
jgi:hypothetical protein